MGFRKWLFIDLVNMFYFSLNPSVQPQKWRMYFGVFFMDLAQAFDTIHRDFMLES